MTLYGVYGASGCGRGVMPLVRQRKDIRSGSARSVFIDDSPSAALMNGHHVLTWRDYCQADQTDKRVIVAIANSTIREFLVQRSSDAGIGFFSVRAENVVIMDDVVIGEGAILSPFVTLTSNIRIGRHFQANLYSYVEHDCVIGDFVTFGPGAKCNGNVHIDDHAYVGAAAVIRQGEPGKPLIIGRGAVVGMGAVVTNDVPAGVTVVGNPARPVHRE